MGVDSEFHGCSICFPFLRFLEVVSQPHQVTDSSFVRTGRYRKPSIGYSGHGGGRRPGQTRKKPKDLSACDRKERGCGEGRSVYA